LYCQIRDIRKIVCFLQQSKNGDEFQSMVKDITDVMISAVSFISGFQCFNVSLIHSLYKSSEMYLSTHNTQHWLFPIYITFSFLLLSLKFKYHRSQVLKELSVTIGYVCHTLGRNAALFGKELLPPLLSLLSKSTKIISSGGDTCIKFIIKVLSLAKRSCSMQKVIVRLLMMKAFSRSEIFP